MGTLKNTTLVPGLVAQPVIVAPERERKDGLKGYPGLCETLSHKKNYSPYTRPWVQYPAQENETIMLKNLVCLGQAT